MSTTEPTRDEREFTPTNEELDLIAQAICGGVRCSCGGWTFEPMGHSRAEDWLWNGSMRLEHSAILEEALFREGFIVSIRRESVGFAVEAGREHAITKHGDHLNPRHAPPFYEGRTRIGSLIAAATAHVRARKEGGK